MDSVDGRFIDWIDAHRTPLLTAVFRAAARAGQLGLAPVAAGFLLDGGATEAPKAGVAWKNAAAALGAYGASMLLSRLLGRGRPCQVGTRPLVPCPDSPSLPSDQAAAAAASAVVLARARPEARIALFGGAAAIGFARVYLGLHYVTDVVAGALVGVGTARALTTRDSAS